MSEQAQETVTINDVSYSIDDLSEQQRYFLSQINDLRQKSGSLRFQLDQVIIAEDYFRQELIKSVEEPTEEVAEE